MILSSFRRFAAPVVCAALLLGCLVAGRAAPEQFPGLDAKWREYRSPNFELYSRASDGFSRELLEDLEVMRATFFQFLELQPQRPTTVSVYVFRSNDKFRAYAATTDFEKKYSLMGEYRVYSDRDVISLGTDEGREAAHWVVYANLANSLLLTTGDPGPSWLREGLSMLWGTFEPGTKTSALGEADDLRRKLVTENPQMDVEALFEVEEGRAHVVAGSQEQTNIFHAKAWALLHYWYCGPSEVPAAEVNRFVRFMLQPGARDDAARVRAKFQEVFKMDYAEMNRRVSRYMRNDRFYSKSLPSPVTPARATYTSRPLDVLEARERLAELLLRSRRDAVAKFVMIEALSGPRAARAAEALGNDAVAEQDVPRARELWARAVEAGTDNVRVLDLVARLEFAQSFASFDFYFRLPEERTALLRDVLAKCIARAPEAGDYYEMLAWVESAASRPSIANINRVQEKFATVRRPANTLLALALVRARFGERDQAIKLLGQLETLNPTASERQIAKVVRDILEKAAGQAAG
jgi:tetratricopeptide (TPR) repeat protein